MQGVNQTEDDAAAEDMEINFNFDLLDLAFETMCSAIRTASFSRKIEAGLNRAAGILAKLLQNLLGRSEGARYSRCCVTVRHGLQRW
jgi:hypothetical protein